ncbi:MAG: hypothetical protein O2960_22595 [Verrucomicrobia bacterium]|nr:hypothetical protein [Verrucomicrobiota bacterium]
MKSREPNRREPFFDILDDSIECHPPSIESVLGQLRAEKRRHQRRRKISFSAVAFLATCLLAWIAVPWRPAKNVAKLEDPPVQQTGGVALLRDPDIMAVRQHSPAEKRVQGLGEREEDTPNSNEPSPPQEESAIFIEHVDDEGLLSLLTGQPVALVHLADGQTQLLMVSHKAQPDF